MAEIVNLRQARKRRTRSEKEITAARNRVAFGRTKSEKARDVIEAEHAARDLDGKKRPRG